MLASIRSSRCKTRITAGFYKGGYEGSSITARVSMRVCSQLIARDPNSVRSSLLAGAEHEAITVSLATQEIVASGFRRGRAWRKHPGRMRVKTRFRVMVCSGFMASSYDCEPAGVSAFAHAVPAGHCCDSLRCWPHRVCQFLDAASSWPSHTFFHPSAVHAA